MSDSWTADVVNDPQRDFDLQIEIYRGDDHWATISRQDSGELLLRVFARETTTEVPTAWLVDLLNRAEADLPKE
ncbi:MAG: hypothetical protein AAF604_23960 [Acidobacteriota bacterium]